MKAYFNRDGLGIEIRGGDNRDGILSDWFVDLDEGEDFYGLSFAELWKAESGTIDVQEDGIATIEAPGDH